MDLDNKTRYPAILFRGAVDEKRLFGSLTARITYDLKGNVLTPAEKQSWPISPGPYKGPYGPMEGDELFYRGGVDIFVFGSARAPGGKPVASMDVRVEAGAGFSTAVRVFGNRHWEKSGWKKLAMTPPQPFESIALTIQNAYGGKDEWDELPIPFPGNPEGKGYITTAENVPGKPLPNIENPEQLIGTWQDQPEPVGVCPCPAGISPRVIGRVVFDEKTGDLKEIKPTYFNHAFPRMIAPAVKSGEKVQVNGVLAEGPLQFVLPKNPLIARVKIGKDSREEPLPLDQIGIDADKRQVFLTYRYPFRYFLRPLEVRSCELLPADQPAQAR